MSNVCPVYGSIFVAFMQNIKQKCLSDWRGFSRLSNSYCQNNTQINILRQLSCKLHYISFINFLWLYESYLAYDWLIVKCCTPQQHKMLHIDKHSKYKGTTILYILNFFSGWWTLTFNFVWHLHPIVGIFTPVYL